MVFENRTNLFKLIIDVRVFCFELFDFKRSSCAGHHIFTLGVHEKLTIKDIVAGSGIAGECYAGSAIFAHIAEDHSLNIAGCTPVTGNVIELAVDDSPFVVPAVEDGSNCSDELFFRVFRERLAGCFKNSRFIFGNNVLEVFNLEFSVERYAKFVFFSFKYFFEGINLFFIGRFEVKHDIAIHLHKTPVAVPGESGVS